jgi:hypothetical protein
LSLLLLIIRKEKHLRNKALFGKAGNGFKTPTLSGIANCVLAEIVKKQIDVVDSAYEIDGAMDLHMFETMPMPALLDNIFIIVKILITI